MRQRDVEKLHGLHDRTVEFVAKMVAPLLDDDASDAAREEAIEGISESALSVTVRSDWYTPGGDASPAEFCILLSWGGPATRIIGTLDEWGEPFDAWVEVQDWFLPWTGFPESAEEKEAILTYARQFYYGEG